MNENQKMNAAIIVNQLEVAQTLALATFPVSHPVRVLVESTLKNIKVVLENDSTITDTVAPAVVPAPVAEVEPVEVAPEQPQVADELEDFLDENIVIAGLTPDEFVQVMDEVPEDLAEVILANEDGDIGITGVIEKDGVTVEVGDWEGNVARMEELLAEEDQNRAEEGEAPLPEPEHAILVTYTRLDGNTLSDDDVQAILDSNASAPLFKIGNLHLNRILDGQNIDTRVAEFEIENPTRSVLQGLALGAIAYRGIKVFPGIGRVEARGSVNFQM